MEIKKFFKNRNKFVELDSEEYNNLIQKINFVKEHDIRASIFLNKSDVVEQEFVNHYDGTRWNQ